MLACILIALVNVSGNDAEFKNDLVRIHVEVISNIYIYRVTNLSAEPLVSFEVEQYAAYNFKRPLGWQKNTSPDRFRAWTEDPSIGIAPNDTATFSLRVSSRGAVLGSGKVSVGFRSGQTCDLTKVWIPVREPLSYIVLVAGVFLVIILLQSAIILRKRRQTKRTAVSVS
jgi:hypothetical protein